MDSRRSHRFWALAGLVGLTGCQRAPVPLDVAPAASAPASVASVALVASAPPSGAAAEAPPSSAEVAALHKYLIETASSHTPVAPQGSPEAFAPAMTGTLSCDRKKCRAGHEICVVSPGTDSRCQGIASWVNHSTPEPEEGFPGLAGITACDGSHNCPKGTVCCLHEVGNAEVQALVCHASLSECRDHTEICDGSSGDCRTPRTKCQDGTCVPR